MQQTVAISFKELNKNLYQYDFLKEKLILEAIKTGIINNKDNFLKCGFDEIKTDDIYLNILAKAKAKGIINNKELFDNLKDKIPQYYHPFQLKLDKKTVADIIKEKEIINIAKFIYGANPTVADIVKLKKTKALSLISFYDFFNNNTMLASSLKKDVAQKLKLSFQPTGFNTLDDKGISNIASLIGKNKEDLKSEYLNLNEIAEIFLPFLRKIPPFRKSIGGIKDEEIEKISNDDYKDLLESIAPEAKELIANNLAKLTEIIKDNKDNFFYLLAKDKSAIKNIILGVEDGCHANSANQINNQALLLATIPNFSESIGGIKDEEIEKILTTFNGENDDYEDLLKSIAPEAKELIANNLAKLNEIIKDNKDNFFYILANDESNEAIKNIILGANGCEENIANQVNDKALLLAIKNSPDISEEKKCSLIPNFNESIGGIKDEEIKKILTTFNGENDNYEDLLKSIAPKEKELIAKNLAKLTEIIKANKDNFFYILAKDKSNEAIKNIILGADDCQANIANQVNDKALLLAIKNSPDISEEKKCSLIPNFIESIGGIKDKEIEKISNDNYEDLLESIAPEAKELIAKNLAKLNEAIKANKDNFFYILAKDKSAIKNIIISVTDGCEANIANQINNQALLLAIGNLQDISEEKKHSLLLLFTLFIKKAVIPLINKGPDLLGGSSSANFLRERGDLLQKTFLPLTALYKWLEFNSSNQIEIIGNDKEELCLENAALMSKINNFAAFEAMQNVIPKDRLKQLFTACRDLNKERKGLYKEVKAEKTKQTNGDNDTPNQDDESSVASEIEAPSSKTMPLLFKKLLSRIRCCKK